MDSFEARLREIKTRLEDTRAEVQNKFTCTCARYDKEQVHVPPEVEDGEVEKAPKKKRRADEAVQQPKKKARSKVIAIEKDAAYKDKSKANTSDEGKFTSHK